MFFWGGNGFSWSFNTNHTTSQRGDLTLIHNSSWIQGDHPDPEFAQFRDAGHGEARVMFSRWDLLFLFSNKRKAPFFREYM